MSGGASVLPSSRTTKSYGQHESIRCNCHRGRHNGLTHAAYLCARGKKVLGLERSHIVGGPRHGRGLPGFKFSVCSYVVSLLRPEIIRDSTCPRHGLKSATDGTFTAHAQRRLSLAASTDTANPAANCPPLQAPTPEAYEGIRQGHAGHVPFREAHSRHGSSDPTSLNPRDRHEAALPRKALSGSRRQAKYDQVQAHDHERHRLPRPNGLRPTCSRRLCPPSGIIGSFLGVRSPGTAYAC